MARCRLLFAFLLLATRTGLCAAPAAERAERPNIVFIMIDTLRADHVGCYGYRRPTTPHLDLLAKEGIRFDQMVSASSWTMPAVGTMFTGLHPSQHGILDSRKHLAKGGHDTGDGTREGRATGPPRVTTNPLVHSKFGYAQGFDTYDDFTVMLAVDLDIFGDAAGKPGTAEPPNAVLGRGGVTSPMVNRFAESFLARQKNADKPFFLFLLYLDPPCRLRAPATPTTPCSATRPSPPPSASTSTGAVPHHPYTPAEKERIVSLYDGEIRYTDEHVGKILATLERLNLDRNTIVVALSDHGEEFWDHGRHAPRRNALRGTRPRPLHPPLPELDSARAPSSATRLPTSTSCPPSLELAGAPIPDQCLRPVPRPCPPQPRRALRPAHRLPRNRPQPRHERQSRPPPQPQARPRPDRRHAPGLRPRGRSPRTAPPSTPLPSPCSRPSTSGTVHMLAAQNRNTTSNPRPRPTGPEAPRQPQDPGLSAMNQIPSIAFPPCSRGQGRRPRSCPDPPQLAAPGGRGYDTHRRPQVECPGATRGARDAPPARPRQLGESPRLRPGCSSASPSLPAPRSTHIAILDRSYGFFAYFAVTYSSLTAAYIFGRILSSMFYRERPLDPRYFPSITVVTASLNGGPLRRGCHRPTARHRLPPRPDSM